MREGCCRSPGSRSRRSTPTMGLTPRASAARYNLSIAKRLHWSVAATAGMPASATASMSAGTRTMLSISEYSVCSRRCTKADDMASSLHVSAGQRRLALECRQGAEGNPDGAEGAAMLGRGLESAQRREMRRGAVALVRRERKARIAGVERLHHCIPMRLRENGCGADGGDTRISLDDGLHGTAEAQILEGRQLVAVDLYVGRTYGQAQQRTAHGEEGRAENVESVDLVAVGPRNRLGQRALADDGGQALSLLPRQRLGIGEASDASARIEDHGRGDDRSSERSAAGFVDAGHAAQHRAHQPLPGAPEPRASVRIASAAH